MLYKYTNTHKQSIRPRNESVYAEMKGSGSAIFCDLTKVSIKKRFIFNFILMVANLLAGTFLYAGFEKRYVNTNNNF